jgi:hypothetical protein
MIDVQKVLVTDHISQLERDAGVSSRVLTALDGHGSPDRAGARGYGLVPRMADAASLRIRVGRWLVALGVAIGGSSAGSDDKRRSMARPA